MWDIWTVQLQLSFPAADRPPSDQELEPMVELMERTEGVCAAVVVPAGGGLAVTVGLSAPDAGTAEARAVSLAISCARYAHLGQVDGCRLLALLDRPDFALGMDAGSLQTIDHRLDQPPLISVD